MAKTAGSDGAAAARRTRVAGKIGGNIKQAWALQGRGRKKAGKISGSVSRTRRTHAST